METSGKPTAQGRVAWVTRPLHKDWVFWIFVFFWTIFSWQLMFNQGRISSLAIGPAITGLAVELPVAFAVTFVIAALPLLILRRLFRGFAAKRDLREGKTSPGYGQDQALGWGVWVVVGVSLFSLVLWFAGRNQNPLISGTNPSASAVQVTPELIEQLESARPDTEQLAQDFVEGLQEKPGFKAYAAFQEIEATLNRYFAEDPTSGGIEELLPTMDRLQGYLVELETSQAVLASNLDLVNTERDMPSGAPDLWRLRDFSDALKPWIDSRLSYYAALQACQAEETETAFIECEWAVQAEWEPVMTSTIPALDTAARNLR